MIRTSAPTIGPRRASLLAAGLCAGILAPAAAFAQSSFSVTPLPTGSTTLTSGRTNVMSDDASVVLGSGLWSLTGGYVPAPTSPSNRTYALSGDGTTVVGTANSRAAVFDQSLTPHPLSVPADSFQSIAYAVSRDASVIAGWWWQNGDDFARTFRWTAASGMVNLGRAADGKAPEPVAISADGQVIAGVTAQRTYLWSAANGFQDIGSFPAHPGGVVTAWDMSGDGNTVVGTVFQAPGLPDSTAFRWTRTGGFTGLGDSLGAVDSQAFAVSPDGNIVVGSTGHDASERAMVWDPVNGLRDLQTLLNDNHFYWTNPDGPSALTRATDISADGRTILADDLLIHLPVSVNLLTLPEPTTLAALPFLALTLRRTRRARH